MSSSVWNTVKGEGKELSFWKWPNPFNAIKRIDVMACNPNWLARVEFYTEVALEFFWTNFIPSPSEVLRNWFLGNYDCGKKAKTSLKNRLPKLPGRDPRVVFAEFARPALTGLFYWWAAQTSINALTTFTTILNAQANCEADNNNCIMRDGYSSLGGPAVGTPVFATLTHDPNDWGQPLICAVGPPPGHRWGICNMTFVNTLAAGGIDFDVWLDIDGSPEVRQSFSLGLGEEVSVTVGNSWNNAQGVQPHYEVFSEIPEPFGRLECFMHRLYVWYAADQPPPYPWPLTNPDQPGLSTLPDCLNRFKGDGSPTN